MEDEAFDRAACCDLVSTILEIVLVDDDLGLALVHELDHRTVVRADRDAVEAGAGIVRCNRRTVNRNLAEDVQGVLRKLLADLQRRILRREELHAAICAGHVGVRRTSVDANPELPALNWILLCVELADAHGVGKLDLHRDALFSAVLVRVCEAAQPHSVQVALRNPRVRTAHVADNELDVWSRASEGLGKSPAPASRHDQRAGARALY